MRKAKRAAAGAAAWQVIRNTDSNVSVWQRARAVPRMIGAKLRGRYPELSGGKLFTMLVLVGYIISPVDFIPELIFSVFGLIDDVAVAVWLTTMVLGESERFVLWERERQAQEAFQHANPRGGGDQNGQGAGQGPSAESGQHTEQAQRARTGRSGTGAERPGGFPEQACPQKQKR